MREEFRSGNCLMFLVELMEKFEEMIFKGEQVVLFLNKRGYFLFVMCRDCGYVL